MSLECDSSRLEQIQERLSKLKKLLKLYNCNLPQLIQRRDDIRSSLVSKDMQVVIEEREKKEKFA